MGEALLGVLLLQLPTQKAGGCVRWRGRAENPVKSKGLHRLCKLIGLSEKIRVQRGDYGFIKVITGWLAAEADMSPSSGSGLNYSSTPVSKNRLGKEEV